LFATAGLKFKSAFRPAGMVFPVVSHPSSGGFLLPDYSNRIFSAFGTHLVDEHCWLYYILIII